MKPAAEGSRKERLGVRRSHPVVGDELVMDRFRLLERIGSGGMGTVFRAFDERLQREVAVKELDAAEPERIMREAQAVARLNHPGIVTLYELGQHDGRAVLVSELVPGSTLSSMHADGMLCDSDVAEVTSDLCEALAHAHHRGVVHRDIKPQNVIVGESGRGERRAKLMDFGIARLAGAPTLSADGEVVGTLAYMSPEQAEGELAGPATDVYSLALMAYECWSGINPLAADSPAETARRIGTGVPPLRLPRPDLPEGLADTIDACLDSDPELRPTPLELHECLEAELDRLDAEHAVPAPRGGRAAGAPAGWRSVGVARPAVLACIALVLVLIAGPSDAGGLALVLAALLVPSLIAGAMASGLAPLGAPVLGAVGVPGAAAGLGACGPTPAARAILGAGAWMWLVGCALGLGLGPDLGLGPQAPRGWAADAGVAAESILKPMTGLESLLGALVFASAAVAMGRLLSVRHASIALLAAMLWAAGVHGALALVGDGSLASRPVGVVAAALLAVAIEFGLRRGQGHRQTQAAARRGRDLGRRRFSGRLVRLRAQVNSESSL